MMYSIFFSFLYEETSTNTLCLLFAWYYVMNLLFIINKEKMRMIKRAYEEKQEKCV